MKEIKAIIQPSKLAKIREAFSQLRQFPGMSICKLERCSYHEDVIVPTSVRDALTDSWPHVRLEIVCPDDQVDELIRIIADVAEAGRPGDELVWVTPVDSFRRFGKN
ncbi:P-II family nitrogen regulator [Methylotetracoccus oryzae]|uniref:P-II family nitrogen regulator n=1 Tax=Methylotetracoccus oryzae TaxID=1919059 RepID=UPI0011190B78|nr:P-II family nitrogen regulator [Methylotetracoccus oryzae]